jgi:hypothetical protein
MTITRTKAQRLLSASELRLYESSRRGVVDDHGATRLKKLIDGTRKQLDKYRARAKSQTREARGKGKRVVDRGGERRGEAPAAAENTALKVELFKDILDRFEAALVRAERRRDPEKGRARPKAEKGKEKSKKAATKKAATRASAKKASAKKSAKKATPSKKASARAAATKREVRATAASKRAPIAEGHARKNVAAAKTSQLAHGAARGRRNQAKRDKR